MKQIIKYFFMILATLFILAIVLLFFSTNGVENDSNTKKELADRAMQQIGFFYNKNGYYPKSLQKIPLYKNEEFVSHVNKRSFQYSAYGEDNSIYIFSWRGGAFDWTGYSCTNDKIKHSKNEMGIVRTYQRANGTVCTVRDLH